MNGKNIMQIRKNPYLHYIFAIHLWENWKTDFEKQNKFVQHAANLQQICLNKLMCMWIYERAVICV